ncbi:MAG TPA: M23 family metallopeptidase [bacterium]|nr:M23 family metallopeptidase [bacterium]
MDCKPYQKASRTHITQHFGVNPKPYQPNGHKGVDWAFKYGTWLVAPQRSIVSKIIGAKNVSEDLAPLSRGYGIVLKSLVENNTYYLYWHCLPVFPVLVGQEVQQGQPVAQMGNSGFVMSGGWVVPVEVRTTKAHLGTHTHQEEFTEIGRREYTNPLLDIDWDIPVRIPWMMKLNAIKVILNKMLNLLK